MTTNKPKCSIFLTKQSVVLNVLKGFYEQTVIYGNTAVVWTNRLSLI